MHRLFRVSSECPESTNIHPFWLVATKSPSSPLEIPIAVQFTGVFSFLSSSSLSYLMKLHLRSEQISVQAFKRAPCRFLCAAPFFLILSSVRWLCCAWVISLCPIVWKVPTGRKLSDHQAHLVSFLSLGDHDNCLLFNIWKQSTYKHPVVYDGKIGLGLVTPTS